MKLNPFKSDQAKQNLSNNMNSAGGKRLQRILIVGGAGVAVTAVSIALAMRGAPEGRGSKLAAPSARPVATNAVSDASVNPAYQAELATDNRDRVIAASKTGGSALPAASPTGFKDFTKQPDQRTSMPVAAPPAPNAANAQNTYEQQRDQARQAEYQKLMTVFNAVPGAKSYAPQGAVAAAQNVTASVAANTSAQGATGSAAPSGAGVKIVSALEDVYAILDSPIDTDGSPLVLAHIEGGRFDGAKLLGQSSMKNNQIEIKIRLMEWRGMPLTVDAYGMDENTRGMLVNGQLDRKLWIRYGMPFFGNALGIAGQLLATQGQQAIVTPIGAAVTSTPVLSPGRIAIAAAGQAVGTMAQGLNSYAQQQRAQVKLPLNSGIGVLFLSDVIYKPSGAPTNYGDLAQRPTEQPTAPMPPAAPVRPMAPQSMQVSPNIQQYAGQGVAAYQLQQQAVLPQQPLN